ncbi:MAG: hypothetical protein ABIJ86_09090 [Spirochaetota bacterium]
MPKTNMLTNRVPEELKERLENSAYFKRYLKGKKKDEIVTGFDAVMKKVKNREVEDWDSC